MKWALRIFLVLCSACVLGAAVLSSRGSFERVSAPRREATASAAALWRVCLSREPRPDRTLLDRCVRVRGTLLHVWQKHDAQGTLQDVHLLLAAHFHLYVVKVLPPFSANLSLGHEVTAVGPLLHPHPEYLGVHEVEAFSLSATAP
jgi:hypothetical protein